jgi:prepilin-type N-terminal cleavage/methylation domain-containing protein/prepilin-type processing-associated H-X9-DG protein
MSRVGWGLSQHSNAQNRPSQPKPGFTLVELLVVISIIGILVGLTLPAVMSAIESGRRTQCANNIRQIAQGVTQYETSLRQYPPNWGQVSTVGSPATNATASTIGLSWMTSILPNLEERSLYDQTSLAQPGLGKTIKTFYAMNYQDSKNGINNLAALSTPVKTFLCPSDTQRGFIGNQKLGPGPYATTNYKACAGSNWIVSVVNGAAGPPLTWPRGRNSGSSDGVDHGNGVICRGGGTTAAGAPIVTASMDIRDGASKTFLIGEAVPQWCGWSLWFWFDGSTATCGIPLNCRLPGTPPESNSDNWKFNYSFMSRHKSGANFALCDGSVSYINEQIDMAVYQGLGTIDGNEAVSVPE